MPRVAVVVVGDLGRSPRMQYQALALADAGLAVDLIGLAGTPALDEVACHPSICCHRIPDPSETGGSVAGAVVGTMRKLARLLQALLGLERPDFLLVQTPPAHPTLPVAWLVARLRRSRLIVDWHNFGSTILALDLGEEHALVRLTRWVERVFGRSATASFCVSRAMKEVLLAEYRVREPIVVLRDRPAWVVDPMPKEEREALLAKLDIPPQQPVIVTSTSWSRDEDMGMLIDAALAFDAALSARRERSVKPTMIATGLGPGRADFERRATHARFENVALRTLWLPWHDYRALLASADLGLCLHRSSSGVDLPMKILDMFGCGLPVCAFDYEGAIGELVRNGENGFLFRTAEELAELLVSCFEAFPDQTPRLSAVRANVAAERAVDWRSNWNRVAKPIFAPKSTRDENDFVAG